MSTEPTKNVGPTPPDPPPEEITTHSAEGRHTLVVCRYSPEMCMADIEQLEERVDKAAFELLAIGVPAVGLVLPQAAAIELHLVPQSPDLLKLISTLRSLIPSMTPAITLDEAAEKKLVVTLCNREAHLFETYALDEADLARPGESIAEQIASMRAARIDVVQAGIEAGNCPST